MEVLRGLEGVWLDAADVVRRRGSKHLHERVDLLLELRRDGHQGLSGLLALHALAGADEALQEGVLGAHHQGDQVGSDRVLVLLEEAVGLVHHVPGEVGNAEGRGVETLVQEVGLALEARVDLVHEGLVRGRLQPALLLQQAEQAGPLAHAPLLLDQVQAGLVVVVLDGRDVDALGLVVVELMLEVVLHKLLVQLLVRIVDAELLEGVDFEHLKTEDVEHPDGLPRLARIVDALVHLHHEPVEQAPIDLLRQGVPRVTGARNVQGDHVDRPPAGAAGAHRAVRERLLELVRVDLEQFRHLAQLVPRGDLGAGRARVLKVHIAQEQDPRQEAEDAGPLALGDAHHAHGLLDHAVALRVVQVVDARAGAEVGVILGLLHVPLASLLSGGPPREVVEDVVVALARGLRHHA